MSTAARLTRDSIVAAALAIVDADGSQALSTRRLAADLGVSGPSLYHHFAGKEEIVAGLVASLYGEIALTVLAPDWKGLISEYAEQLRAILDRHPHAVEIVLSAPVRTEPQLRVYEHIARVLSESGLAPLRCRQILFSTDSVIFGAMAMAGAGVVDPADVGGEDYPALARITSQTQRPSSMDTFRLTFDAFVAGLDNVT